MNQLVHCDAAFSRLVVSRCIAALEKAGFTCFRKAEVDWPLNHDVHCWIGLNTGLNADYVQINPFVGVHVISIMRLYSRMSGRKYDRGIATYAEHLGTLTPKERVFRFSRGTDIDSEAARLAHLLSTAGVDYAKSIARIEDLLPLFEKQLHTLGAFPERYAAALYLDGRRAEAKAFVLDFLNRNRDYFERFAVPFLKLDDLQP